MTLLDWALLLVWLGLALSGFWKGAVRLVFGIGGVAAGVWLAVVAGADASAALAPIVSIPWLAAALGRALPILLCVAACVAAGWGLERTVEALHLGWLNRLSGAALTGAFGAMLLAVVVGAAARLSPACSQLCSRSLLAPPLLRLLDVAAPPAQEGTITPSGTLESEGEATPDATPETISSGSGSGSRSGES